MFEIEFLVALRVLFVSEYILLKIITIEKQTYNMRLAFIAIISFEDLVTNWHGFLRYHLENFLKRILLKYILLTKLKTSSL